jgi:hypothetical protein
MSRRPQHLRVLDMLVAEDQVCAVTFIRNYLPNFPRQIHRLRHMRCCPGGVQAGCKIEDGYHIKTRVCDMHRHESRVGMYRLVADDQCMCGGTGIIPRYGTQPTRRCACRSKS